MKVVVALLNYANAPENQQVYIFSHFLSVKVSEFLSCYRRSSVWNRRIDTMEVVVALLNFANAPEHQQA